MTFDVSKQVSYHLLLAHLLGNGELLVHSIDLFTARKFLDTFDEYETSPTDDQREARDKLEWVVNNAHKLQVMFFGRIDRSAMQDVETCFMTLRAMWRDPGKDAKPHTLH